MARFPLPARPAQSYHDAPRNFGASRDHGTRKHAGCDLYAAVGTPIRALDDGIVVRGKYDFYLDTFAIEVDHGDFIARYGEIRDVAPGVVQGATVQAGQVIAFVGKLTGLTQSMLHLELYRKTATGALTQKDKPPFMRRADLMDPTPILDAAEP